MPGPGTAAMTSAASRNNVKLVLFNATSLAGWVSQQRYPCSALSSPAKKRVIQYSRGVSVSLRSCGVLDTPPSRGMTKAESMRSRQTERDDLFERGLHRRGREQRQRIHRHRAVMLGAADRVFQRAMLGHQSDGMIEVAVADLAALQCLDPERALSVIAAAE